MVIAEHSTESLATLDATLGRETFLWENQLVVATLVVPFCVIVQYIFGYRCPQVSLTERHEAGETLSTDGENESFRVGCLASTIFSG